MSKHRNKYNLCERESVILREYRLNKGYSQQDVADRVGVQIRQYQRWEYGERSISLASMKLGLSVCSVLNIDPFWLIFGEHT